ncbi:GFA family protein [Hoeflea sp.]|uniref:GFA family protein n=1 Tax=Hoeflea sp. TaxID=1940281 RepID=UPI0019AF3FC4|nr:GFA family protein [Hoeflea sp.]MBC7281790.1 GFA family protein [Hoeflea sp.]
MHQTIVPPLPLSGGCQCGRIRYKMLGAPLVFYLCHCTECQRHTSSAFGESLRFRRDDLDVGPGLRCIRRQSESGREREGWFCPECGVRIWHGTSGSAEINIKAGTLDDTSWLIPAGHIWTRSKQPFVVIPAGEIHYETQPADGYAALRQEWDRMTSVPRPAATAPD